ncbi:sister chromatid cohesion 1 protein 4-like isoform X1 [Musa acuminata AAA Group]|uniref:sister chromatid cohesion 1 protein 4-like isoform X1 n=1 Tax=Musa acuminata AAA Group TaxID=214697 RepID=UPI0031CF7058
MFYSQFILAKKGPLGTIWIAAHLERKLRKNQVADTDIGVSVDSILFPEAPIALRLSSHLLLGVVRIYSRKVNYLFHDCSEALLKIKQAFRSTAVDLPPEESTAPYHSITLPETFHLDDFELPDSAGDFVDHHVSTKEQITLQDTMDGTGYSTLQFGLDERFGDGNASQIRLDLDEDLFLEDSHPSSQLASSNVAPGECAVHQGQSSSSIPLTQMDIDHDQNGLVEDIDTEATKELSNSHERHTHPSILYMKKNDIYNIQTPDLNEVFSPNDHVEGPSAAPSQSFVGSIADGVPTPDLAECPHAPPTPGLMEEMFLGNMHEGPALSPQTKPSSSFDEVLKHGNSNLQNGHPDSVTDSGVMPEVTVAPDSANIVQVVVSPTSELVEHKEQVTATVETEMECQQKNSSDLQNGYVCSETKDVTVDEQIQDNGEAMPPEVAQIESLVSSNASYEESNSKAHVDRSQVDTEVAISNSCGVEGQPSGCCSTEHVEDVNPSLNGDASALSSDFHLRSFTSEINQVKILSAQDKTSAQNICGVSIEEPSVPSQTPGQENKLHDSESSFELQGKDSNGANTTDADLEVRENPQDVLTGSAVDVSNTDELLADLSQKDTQKNQLNCSLSSEFPEPEKMLLASTGDVDHANELSQVTEEKGVIESDGSVNRITSLSGKKRRPMETISALQNGSSGKIYGRSRLRKNTEYVPDDDDLLASILVGKKTPLLRIGSTPPHKATSPKRPRLAPRLCMPKRKVLLDDTTVLHADAIRQQLMNTEDIRRMRKKAPCTRPEIWMIQKSSLEDEIFNEPMMTGISSIMNDLHTRRYDPETTRNYSCENIDGQMQGPSHVSLTAEVQSSTSKNGCDDQKHSVPFLPLLEHSGNDGSCMMLPTEINNGKDAGVGTPMPSAAPSSEYEQPRDGSSVMNDEAKHFTENDSTIDLASAGGDSKDRMVDNNALAIADDDHIMHIEEAHASNDASTVDRGMGPPDAITSSDPQDMCAVAEANGEALISELDNVNRESEGHLVTDPVPGTDDRIIEGEIVGAKVENEEKLMHEGNLISDVICSERLETVSSSPSQINNESGNVPSAIRENSSFQEFIPDGGIIVESTPMDLVTGKECSDFCSTIDGNDTEFLNVDDEIDYHEGDDDVPNAEGGSLENSGWSSRTRGVARYLKILFDEEFGRGRKSVAMDQLIAGKTRKEASRMFFETLVLKTKDFIQVEQERPSDYITIRPRSKLLKAEF